MTEPSAHAASSKTVTLKEYPQAILALIVALTAGIFLMDLVTPLGWADGFLYLIPLILIFRSPHHHHLVGFTALCSGLIILGWLFSSPGGAVGPMIYNRSIGIALLWMTALFLRHRKQVEEALYLSQEALEQRVEERTAEFRLAIEKLKQEIADRKRAEEALRSSEERFRLIVSHVSDAIVYLDLAGIVRWANHQAVVLSGRSMEEMVGQSFMAVLAPEAAARAEARLDAIRRGESVPPLVEFEINRPDGNLIWVEANFTSVLEDGKVVGRLLVSRDITERKQAEEALRESEQRLSQLLEDRERISRDLHDNIIQTLYAIGLGIEESQRLFGENSKPASSNLSNAIKELNSVIRDVRSYIAWSEPKVLDGRQLKAAIERLARTMEGTHLLHFRLKVDREAADKLTPEEASHVLYIVREAMSNSLRHSKARDGIVSLQVSDENICLTVADAGDGFDTTNPERYGQGLRNIAVRAQKLDARLQIVSEPGLGVRIVLDIPKVKKHASA
jgi:PAS domain S-box-containing protein